MPEASRLSGMSECQARRIKELIQRAVKGLLITATPLYLLLFVFASPLTHVWLRQSFNPAVPSTLRFFLVGTFFSLLGTPYYYALIGLGRAQFVLWANALQFVVCIVGVLAILKTAKIEKTFELPAVLGVADIALTLSTLVLVLLMAKALARYEQQAPSVLEPAAA